MGTVTSFPSSCQLSVIPLPAFPSPESLSACPIPDVPTRARTAQRAQHPRGELMSSSPCRCSEGTTVRSRVSVLTS